MFFAAMIFAVGVGVAMSARSPTNASLGLKVGAIQASLVNFVVGFVLLLLLSLIMGSGDYSAALHVPSWQLIGGIYGATVIFSVAFSSPKLGVSLALALLMLGQIAGGMVVDQFGWFMATQIPLTPLRIFGGLLVMAGIVLVCVGGMHNGSSRAGQDSKQLVACSALMLVAGFVSACQLPTNSALAASVGTIEAGALNFACGAIVLLVITLITNRGRLNSFKGAKPWEFTGGIYGAFSVVANVVATPILGVGLAMAACMFSQMLGGMVVDSFGLFRARKIKVNVWRVAGTVVLLMGVACVTVAKIQM